MKGLSKEVKSAIIIGVVIVLLLVLGIIYGQKEKTEVVDTSTLTTTVAEVESTTAAASEETTAAESTTAAPTTSASVTIPAGATVTKASDGQWALVNNGSVVTNFTGIAKNDLGSWYIESGYVNFGFSGKVVFNGVTYDIENGKVV